MSINFADVQEDYRAEHQKLLEASTTENRKFLAESRRDNEQRMERM